MLASAAVRHLAILLASSVGVGCGASSDDIQALKTDLARLKAEAREARREAARAREDVAALNLKAEVQAFLQNDPALQDGGAFTALDRRIGHASRAFTFTLASTEPSTALWFKVGYKIRLDFVASSGSASAMGNRLEVYTQTESFEPVDLAANEHDAYVLEEDQGMTVKTLPPSRSSSSGKAKKKRKGRRKRKKAAGRSSAYASQILFRYLPVGGPDAGRSAYVRVSFLGPAVEPGAGEAEVDGDDEPAVAEAEDDEAEAQDDTEEEVGDDEGTFDFGMEETE